MLLSGAGAGSKLDRLHNTAEHWSTKMFPYLYGQSGWLPYRPGDEAPAKTLTLIQLSQKMNNEM